ANFCPPIHPASPDLALPAGATTAYRDGIWGFRPPIPGPGGPRHKSDSPPSPSRATPSLAILLTMRRPQLPALAALLALPGLLGLAACEPASAETDATPTPATAEPATAEDSALTALLARADLGRIKGDSAAPVWLVVVSDFQCPYCKV